MSESNIDFEALLSDPEAMKQLPKELREYAERQSTAAKNAQEENAKLAKELRERKTADFLKDKGLSADLAGLVGDSDPNEWYATYGQHFAAQSAGEGETPPAGAETGGDAGAPADAAAAAPGTPSTPLGQRLPSGMDADQAANYAAVVGAVPSTPGSHQPGSFEAVHDSITVATEGALSVEDYVRRLKTVPGAVQGH
jgi:hypothetical protein